MKRILLPGMSGVGKSTVGMALRGLGYKAVDLDDGYCASDGTWDESLVDELLGTSDTEVLFVIGAADNQPKFYPRFDLIVLLSAPIEVTLERVATRTSNPFGKTAEQLAKIQADTATYVPLIRRRADYEIRTDRSTDLVVKELVALVFALARR